MSRTLRKAVENAKQKKETEINLVEEGIAHLEEVPELCEWWEKICQVKSDLPLLIPQSFSTI